MSRDAEITTTPMTTQLVTTLQITFRGIGGDDQRLNDLIEVIHRWSDDALGIIEPPHSVNTQLVPVRPTT